MELDNGGDKRIDVFVRSFSRMLDFADSNSLSIISQIRLDALLSNMDRDSSRVDKMAFSWYSLI